MNRRQTRADSMGAANMSQLELAIVSLFVVTEYIN